MPAVVSPPVVGQGAAAADEESRHQVLLRRPAVVAGPPPVRRREVGVGHRGHVHRLFRRRVELDGVGLRRHVGPELSQGVRGVRVVRREVHHLLRGRKATAERGGWGEIASVWRGMRRQKQGVRHPASQPPWGKPACDGIDHKLEEETITK